MKFRNNIQKKTIPIHSSAARFQYNPDSIDKPLILNNHTESFYVNALINDYGSPRYYTDKTNVYSSGSNYYSTLINNVILSSFNTPTGAHVELRLPCMDAENSTLFYNMCVFLYNDTPNSLLNFDTSRMMLNSYYLYQSFLILTILENHADYPWYRTVDLKNILNVYMLATPSVSDVIAKYNALLTLNDDIKSEVQKLKHDDYYLLNLPMYANYRSMSQAFNAITI